MSKQSRQYQDSAAERAAATVAFLESLRFSRPLSVLREHPERQPCPQCGKRRQYYCYDCLKVTNPLTQPPPLQLPVRVHVVLHPGETRGKSTTLPIATVSPQVAIHTYPAVPELDPKTTLVLYPSPTAVEIEDITDAPSITDVVFVDSTWHQSKAIAADDRVKRYRHVKFSGIVSLFWRFQDRDPFHLATVEAIYHTLRRLIAARNKTLGQRPDQPVASEGTAAAPTSGATGGSALDAWYGGEADDLLYYYVNQYIAVQQSYQGDDRQFTEKHFEGYVLKHVDWDALLRKCSGGDQAAAAPAAGTPAAKRGASDQRDAQPTRRQPSAEEGDSTA
jgi:hypothetical protein